MEFRESEREIREFKMKERERREIKKKVIDEDGAVLGLCFWVWIEEMTDSHAPMRMMAPPARV